MSKYRVVFNSGESVEVESGASYNTPEIVAEKCDTIMLKIGDFQVLDKNMVKYILKISEQ